MDIVHVIENNLSLKFHTHFLGNRKNLQTGLERGAGFAVYYKGDLVVNIWGGYSDYDCRRLWKEDTLSTFFSTTKAVAAFVIAHMVDRWGL